MAVAPPQIQSVAPPQIQSGRGRAHTVGIPFIYSEGSPEICHTKTLHLHSTTAGIQGKIVFGTNNRLYCAYN